MSEITTPAQAATEVQRIKRYYSADVEYLHVRLDALLLSILDELGYDGLVAEFKDTLLWYA